ncbi:D-ribose pyranase [Tepidibacillus infernus]|uniref:D-ribose pyranase n=1 Tax=Tepidibacillus decaturensis TaxID=1413211 RepID=A0A135L5B4_9BACI|nr:D-ribose pyranase [Tepidibacillus decaturensis]KXG44188.1 hypothetical protein U473_09380 [Tepidibacillus decaturensis]
MKKRGILNSEIATVLSKMGHTDMIVIADCGLPIPDEVKRIDLALEQGLPSFLKTLDVILEDIVVEKVTLAHEIKDQNPTLDLEVKKRFDQQKLNYLSHEELKELTKRAKAVIRTGEATPYANIVLHAGVIF